MERAKNRLPHWTLLERQGKGVSELVSSWKEPTCSLNLLDGRGKGQGSTKKRVFKEGEWVSSWKEPTCSLNSLDGLGKGWGTTQKRVFEGGEWVS